MKSNIKVQIAITLALILLIQICESSQKAKADNASSNKDKALLTNSDKSLSKTKGPADKMLPLRNAVGRKMKKNTILTKIPMKVKRCDQIAFFPAKYITDFADYRLRKPGYFAMNAHSVSIYKDKDANNLIHQVLWANVKKKPNHLDGGKGCITIDSGAPHADISICFDSKAEAKNLLKAIGSFYKCRGGDNLQPVPKDLVRKLLQICGKNGKIISGKKHKKFKMSLTGRAGNKWDSNRMLYHHPDPIVVPGTYIPKKKKKLNK
jgi:hypothetical protein